MRHRPAALPEGAAVWLDQAAVGVIHGVRRLTGGLTTDLFALDVVDVGGARRRLVLRWYPSGGVLDDEPDLVEREVAALRSLAGTDVLAPSLVASGPRAVLMSHIHGGVRLALPDPGALRDALAVVHGLDPTPVARWPYTGHHEGRITGRPTWWRDARAWERAVRQTETARPGGADVFLHRDLHPGNVLWRGRRITGIVDWVNACAGPAAVDFAHCRVNLAVLWGLDAADAFAVVDPAWDVEAALGFLDWGPGELDAWPGGLPRSFVEGGGPDLSAAQLRERLEAFVREALARLG